jgi:hypothetical protein
MRKTRIEMRNTFYPRLIILTVQSTHIVIVVQNKKYFLFNQVLRKENEYQEMIKDFTPQ